MSGRSEVQAYLAESAGWDAQWRRQERRFRRLAWTAAGGGLALAALAGITLLVLLPLKRVEPYLIRVDSTSGVVDVVPAYQGSATFPESVTRYFLSHYVSTCERYMAAAAEQDYTECGAFHGPQRNQEWAAHWATGNPESPLNRYRDGTAVHVSVTAVSFFTRGTGLNDLAQVRFARLTQPGGTGAETATHWIATIRYQFGTPATDEARRRWNPLGFRILDYHVEPELIETTAKATPGSSS